MNPRPVPPIPAGGDRGFLLLLALLLLPNPLPAAQIEAGGFLKGAFFEAQDVTLDGGDEDVAMLAARIRLDLAAAAGPLRLEVSPEARVSGYPGERPGGTFIGFGGNLDQGFFDLSRTFLDEEDREGVLVLDRLRLTGNFGAFRVDVGRQPVGFGTSLFWAPTDLVTPFSPAELDREVRPGTDAARLLWSPGRHSEFGVLWAPGHDFEENTVLAHGRFPSGPVEVFLIGGTVKDRRIAGGSLMGEAAGMGLRAEGILLESRNTGPGGEEIAWKAEITGGFDYRFDTGIYLAAEYLYNGAGTNDSDGYADLMLREPFSLGLVPFLGRHYLLARASKQLHPLVESSLTAYWNLSDSSVFFWPQVGVSLSDNLQLAAFLFLPSGPSGSEFGERPSLFGLFLTQSF